LTAVISLDLPPTRWTRRPTETRSECLVPVRPKQPIYREAMTSASAAITPSALNVGA
jgi:hypothetical protein